MPCLYKQEGNVHTYATSTSHSFHIPFISVWHSNHYFKAQFFTLVSSDSHLSSTDRRSSPPVFVSQQITMHHSLLVVAALAIFLHSATAYPTAYPGVSICFGPLRINCPEPPAPVASPAPPTNDNTTRTYGDHPGSISQYPDGSGTFVRLDDNSTFPNGDRCWTDLYYMSSSDQKSPWERQAINHCNGNSSECRIILSEGVETCNKWSLDVEVGLEMPLLESIFDISGSVAVGAEWSRCDSLMIGQECKWVDRKCHTIYARMSKRTDYGYIRRRCNFQGAGDKTYWSKDWNITEKGTVPELGCDANCDAAVYPEP